MEVTSFQSMCNKKNSDPYNITPNLLQNIYNIISQKQ